MTQDLLGLPHTRHASTPAARFALPGLENEVARLRSELARAEGALAALRAALVQARRLARSDALTGLPNRLGFDSLCARALDEHAGDRLLALLFIDLDDFKAVNDRFGHAAGDALLRIVGARIAHAVRRGDVVCRRGGDEFVCLLPNLRSPLRALAVGRKLVRLIAQPCQLGAHAARVQASIGIALQPRDGADVAALLRRADEAMYVAKSRRSGVALADAACSGSTAADRQDLAA